MSKDQEQAYDQIMRWVSSGDDPVHGLFGWAGTGKTYLLKRIAEDLNNVDADDYREDSSNVWVMCYTGKAASVLRNRGFKGATTIHRRLYRPFDPAEEEREDLYTKLRAAPDEDERQLLLRDIADLPNIVYNNTNPDIFEEGRPELIVIDEASMVDERIGDDLMRLGVKILTVGDPFQLPPVARSTGFFDKMDMPKVYLTENHRQTEGGDIIEMARLIRERGELRATGSAATVVDRMPGDWYANFDQTLCGLNRTRHLYNVQARRRLHGREPGNPPGVGDILVRLRNDYAAGLLNGTTWRVRETWPIENSANIGATVKSLAGDDRETNVRLDPDHFGGQNYSDELFNYGFTLTTHKAQGSEWDSVLVVDESAAFARNGKEMAHRWLYTAVTRAVNRVTVVRDAYVPSGSSNNSTARGFAAFNSSR